MDCFEGFPGAVYDVGKEDNVDILGRIVTDYCTYACVVAFLLREYDFSCIINRELYPISEHMLPVISDMVENLGNKEGCRQLR